MGYYCALSVRFRWYWLGGWEDPVLSNQFQYLEPDDAHKPACYTKSYVIDVQCGEVKNSLKEWYIKSETKK